MRIPDWLIYGVVLTAVLYGVFSEADHADAPAAPPSDLINEGMLLPGPTPFDEKVLIEGEDFTGPTTGTAFAVDGEGYWLTARHVVDECRDLYIDIGQRRYVPVVHFEVYENGDLALLQTEGGPEPVALDLTSAMHVGQEGYHIGYPQGKPGEVTSRLLNRSSLITRGRHSSTEPVLAWAEAGRTRGLIGSLGGISGGPVYNADGDVIGVTVAESPRRGRIYTTAPISFTNFRPVLGDQSFREGDHRPLTPQNYGGEADRLRRNLTIVPVICNER